HPGARLAEEHMPGFVGVQVHQPVHQQAGGEQHQREAKVGIHTVSGIGTFRGFMTSPFKIRTKPRRQPCHAETGPATPTSKSARPSTSRKATKTRASRRKRPNAGPGPPSTRKTGAARIRARVGKSRPEFGPARRAG